MHSKYAVDATQKHQALILNTFSDDDSNISLFVVQCDLYSEDGKELRGQVYNPSAAAPTSGKRRGSSKCKIVM